ncbi:hypothetical protein D9M68_653690 [compost metagenome]
MLVTISSVSSSWLRRKMAHWQPSGMSGVWAMISTMGCRSSCAMAMYMRGMSGKWYAMWHSSPSPKYSRTSSGHMLASASRKRFLYCASMAARSFLITACVSGRFSLLVPSRSTR